MLYVQLDREAYSPGDTVSATITVVEKKPKKARSLNATLTCFERKIVKTQVINDRYDFDRDREMGIPYSSHMETRSEERSNVLFEERKEVSGSREFSNETGFTAQFLLPQNAKPTSHEFGHDASVHSWRITVKLDVPLAVDENAEKEVFVVGL